MSDQDVTEQINQTDELPEWAREQITKANKQAAKYRTERNEAVEAAKAEVAASFQPKIEELEAQLSEKDTEVCSARNEVVRLKVALQAGIDADRALSFADLLKGENEDELRSHAEELKKLFGEPSQDSGKRGAVDPSQGESGAPLPLNGDPLLDQVMRVITRQR